MRLRYLRRLLPQGGRWSHQGRLRCYRGAAKGFIPQVQNNVFVPVVSTIRAAVVVLCALCSICWSRFVETGTHCFENNAGAGRHTLRSRPSQCGIALGQCPSSLWLDLANVTPSNTELFTLVTLMRSCQNRDAAPFAGYGRTCGTYFVFCDIFYVTYDID